MLKVHLSIIKLLVDNSQYYFQFCTLVKQLQNMPRPRVNFAIKQASNRLVQARHLVIISSEEQGQYLVTQCKKVKFALQMKKLQHNIQALSASAFQSNKIALALNQIGLNERVFVINKEALQKKGIQDLKLNNFSQRTKQILDIHSLKFQDFSLISCKQDFKDSWCNQKLKEGYEDFINPVLLFGQNLNTQSQECISLPFFKFNIPRFNNIALKYVNINNQPKYAFAQGSIARVIQHQIQHLNGKILLDWRINHGNISIQKQVQQYFPKTNNVVQDFSRQLKGVFKQFPNLIQTKQYFLQQKQQDFHRASTNSSQWVLKSVYKQLLSFQDDCITRIVKHFKKQIEKFHQKVVIGQIRMQQNTININQGGSQIASPKIQSTINRKSLIIETDQKQGYLQQQYSKNLVIKKLQPITRHKQIQEQEEEQLYQKHTKKAQKKKGKKGKK